MSPIPITEPQLLVIANAAAALRPSDRDQFIPRAHAELCGQSIGNGSIGRAIRIAQASFAHPEPDREPHMRPRARAFVK
jgi:hypothetical protein